MVGYKGHVVELALNKVFTLREQCIKFIKKNLHQWPGVSWEEHLPATLLSEIFSPYKFT